MTLRVASHQPSFFPWAGYWHKVASADVLVVSAGVKMDYRGYQNRVKLRGDWWTLPVPRASKHMALKDVAFERAALHKTIEHARQMLCGKKWPHGGVTAQILDDTLRELGQSNSLLDLNVAALDAVRGALGLSTLVIVNEQAPDPSLSRTQNLRLRVQPGTMPFEYLAGQGTADYLDVDQLPASCSVLVQKRAKAVDTGTVLQLISKHGTPLDEIRGAFTWRCFDGGQEHTGDRAAFG